MKVSELTIKEISQQLRENEAALSEDEKNFILGLKEAAVAYVKSHTGIGGVDEPDENGRKLDDYEDITVAVLALISQMYDNRQMTISSEKVNPVVPMLLGIHDFNLVPGSESV
jgi:hypothetical protein